jgi:hypothetical protein
MAAASYEEDAVSLNGSCPMTVSKSRDKMQTRRVLSEEP